MADYDVAIIGTSPACVFEMATLETQGLRTVMVDREREVGGAWGTIELPILGVVESGAHYLPAIPGIYEFYERVLGMAFDPVLTPKYFLPRAVFGKNHTSWLNSWGGGVSPFDEMFPTTVKSWRNAISPYYRATREILGLAGPKRRPMRYFRNGTPGLVERLTAFVRERRLDVKLRTTVKRVEIDTRAGRVTLVTDNGAVGSRKFVLTSCSELDSFVVDGERRPIPSASNPLLQLHLVLQGPPVANLSFGQYANSPYLTLTSNVTPFLRPELAQQGYSLLTNLATNTLPQSRESVDKVIAEHRAHGLIDDRHRLVAAHWKIYQVPQRQDDELAQVARDFAPRVDVLPTHSFGGTMEARVADWSRALMRDAAPTK